MVEIKGASFSYTSGKKQYEVFRDLSFSVKDEEFFCIVGPSGCGKSTLLKIIAGFEKLSGGEIANDGQEIAGIHYERAMVFQEDAVFPWMNVYSNIEYGLKMRGVAETARKEIVTSYIGLVGLEGFEKAYPKELSGGMKKRVDLARVLANNPKLLLMDEPFGALDAMTKEKLQEKLVQMWEVSKKTIIFITHDIEEALFLGDRIAIMQNIRHGGEFAIFDVPFTRPRNIFLKEDQGFQHMRREIVEEFKKYEEEN